jgi:general secretion pathway protein J
VAYRIVNGTLVRRESAPTRDMAQLDALWQSQISDTDTSGAVALLPGVAGMQISTWQNNAWHQAGVDPSVNANNANNGAATNANYANPANPQIPPAANAAVASDPTGLMVALQAQGQQVPMSKSFLLGGL